MLFGWVVVGEAAGELRRVGGIEFPAQAEVDRQLGRDRPLILPEHEDLPAAQGGEVSCQIAAGLVRKIEQEARQIVQIVRGRRTSVGQFRVPSGQVRTDTRRAG